MQNHFAYTMRIDPVDPGLPVQLPEPWPRLQDRGFHPDLLERARGYQQAAQRLGEPFCAVASDYLTGVGWGFLEPFDQSDFTVADDVYADFRRQGLSALSQLSVTFGDRVSSVVWNSYAFMIMRDQPDQTETIFEQAEKLPYPFWVVDSVWHAAGKVYGLKQHIDSVIYLYTGSMTEHNCDCSHSVYPSSPNSVVCNFLPTLRHQEATAALFSHMCSEALLIGGLGMPFEIGVSPEAAAAMV